MIDRVDEALRRLLHRDLPVKNGEIDIEFDQPNREWSARLSRPTLNLFLYDMRENTHLRQPSPQWQVSRNDDSSVTQRRRPVRVDLFYAITAWATEPADEHRLLTRTLGALFRNPFIPDDLLPQELQDQPAPIAIEVAQQEMLQNLSDFWNALDNRIRPAITCRITVAVDPYAPISTPVVGERELTFRDTTSGETETAGQELWTVTGTVTGVGPGRGARIRVVEIEADVPVEQNGKYTIRGLKAGTYTFEVARFGQPTRQQIVEVPSPTYDITV